MVKTSFILVMVLGLFMFAIAGCNGNDVGDSDTDTPDSTKVGTSTPESSEVETSPTLQEELLKDYQKLSTHEDTGPEDSTLIVSAYLATTATTAENALGDFGKWAEQEGWSLLEGMESERYYYKGDEVMHLMVAEESGNVAITVMTGLPLSHIEEMLGIE